MSLLKGGLYIEVVSVTRYFSHLWDIIFTSIMEEFSTRAGTKVDA